MRSGFGCGLRAILCCVVFIVSSFALNGLATADDQIAKAPAEGWVEFVDLPKADPAYRDRIKNGISNLLSDFQYKYRDGGYTRFDRYAYQIVDRPGLDRGAGLNFEFDPARHKVTLNRLHVVRDGVVLDRLPDVKFDVYRREKDSEKGIFDGRLTAHVNIEDVRVGDIVDYATTYEVTPIVGAGLFIEQFSTEWTEPVALIHERIVWPTSQPLQIRPTATSIKPSITASGADTVYAWKIANPAPIKWEDNLPVDYPNQGIVEISSTANWQDVVDAILPYYQPTTAFPKEFTDRLARIAAQYPKPEDRMVEALRLVQDEIRYVSLSIGAGSYVPRSPETVLASGFGDCKDKALLLTSALRHLGIEAYVSLADLDEGRALYQRLPSLRAFDHAIVKAVIGERVYWLDATSYLQGGRAENLSQPAYGFALPLIPSKATLEKMLQPEPAKPTTSVVERFEFPKQEGGPLTLSVTTTYFDADADAMRRKLAGESLSKIGDDYLQYYSKQYPGLKSLAALETKDDRDRNIVSVKEAYELAATALQANDLNKSFPLKADVGVSNLPTPTMVERVGPVSLGSLTYKHHKVIVTNLKTRFIGPQNGDVLTPELSFKISYSNTPTEFEVDWNYKTLTDKVPATRIVEYLKAADDVNRNAQWNYDFTQTGAIAPEDDDSVLRAVTVSGLLLSFLCLVGIVIRETRKPILPSDQHYWPQSVQKFVLMSLLSVGVYACFWAWRAFRQKRANTASKIWPFWRAVFYPVWLIPAFLDVTRQLPDRKLPLWTIVVGTSAVAIVFLVKFFIASSEYTLLLWWNVIFLANFFVAFNEYTSPFWWNVFATVIYCLAALPLLVVINRLNDTAPENELRNSTFSGWDFFGLAATAVFMTSAWYLPA